MSEASVAPEMAVPQGLPSQILHYINGEAVPSLGGETFEVINPVTAEHTALPLIQVFDERELRAR